MFHDNRGFHYNKYSHYNLLDDDGNKYRKIMDELLEQAEHHSVEIRKKVHGILFEGGFGDFSVNSGITTPDNKWHEKTRRLNLASLLISDPETFEVIADNNAILFHGTNSNALDNILQHGMCSEAEAIRRGLKVLSGEFALKSRDFISFTDKLNLAIGYSTLKPSVNAESDESFSVLIGISIDDIRTPDSEINTMTIHSSMSEIGIQKHLPRELIRFIAVPKIKVQEVSRIVEQYGLSHIHVVPSEGMALATEAAWNHNPSEEFLCTPESLIISGRNSEEKASILQQSVKNFSIPRGQKKPFFEWVKDGFVEQFEKAMELLVKEGKRI
jgi:hypothetical protein